MSGKIYAPLKTTGLTNDPNDPTNTYGDITTHTTASSSGALMQKLLTVAKFLGLK
ncbi:MAG: hypothetical protein KDA17_02190 [Candidatus Saccharibacteria bacterium]|nr:hypothetical protein [Candidatus Saccharibacteria bacterium]